MNINKFYHNQSEEISAKIFATIPAKESSENPIVTNYDSNSFIKVFPLIAFDMLFKVKAANLVNFYWFVICCNTPIIIPINPKLFAIVYLA